ncbi:STAS domain-containing protein [Schinkia azotoformans]|uniref:Anti-sigma factor antagonist n=1 Tax=Schinkia azotoformans LMG 9581 TaxID=1131731 RepID=K6D550_SCHAZ|nr:STAS domain-containing protein [Schinkia azotoformans]EKN63173.1 anti-sigma factor antagonist [Schinkia azotoformans LMG 9581]MEC1637276.1 STAS domain-containing protein [Schinkia azotoformans]MEC1720724.1 STAS domain-containing protein [Schinkia azotoformans]MEC1943680.1 STAS domain-containing protein [Schinkia azotoformans]MED4411863.1 STAS domain-containing protein [Schinkia azotoformans]
MFQTLVWNDNISLSNIDRFEKSIKRLLYANLNGLILNLENVSYMNECALGIIADSIKEAKEMNKELVIINNTTTIRTIFEIVRFYSIVQVFSYERDALHYLEDYFSSTTRKVV